MRYRALDENGDMTFGRGGLNFLVNSPDAVAQAALTRLRLSEGEWFLDVTEGTPYQTQVLGFGTSKSRDVAIRNRIIGTLGVTEIVSYSSNLDAGRNLFVSVLANSVYGQVQIEVES